MSGKVKMVTFSCPVNKASAVGTSWTEDARGMQEGRSDGPVMGGGAAERGLQPTYHTRPGRTRVLLRRAHSRAPGTGALAAEGDAHGAWQARIPLRCQETPSHSDLLAPCSALGQVPPAL